MSCSSTSDNRTMEYLPLTNGQTWLLGETSKMKYPGWASVEILVKTKIPMDEQALKNASNYLVERYENLRVRFVVKEGEWVQELYSLDKATPFEVFDLSGVEDEQKTEKVKEICVQTRRWTSVGKGNLLKVLFFRFSSSEGRVWVYTHHLVSDFVSMLILCNDFLYAYNCFVLNKEIKRKTLTDFRKWQYIVDGYSRDVLIPSDLDYWLSRPWHEAKVPPSDFPDRFATEKVIAASIDAKSVVNSYKTNYSSLDKDLSSRLLGAYGLELEPVLLAAFFLSVANRWNLDWIDISVSYAGRNVLPPSFEVNENRLVGFLASTRAMLLKKPAGENLSMDIREVIHQIKSVPRNGSSFSRIQQCLKDRDQRKSFDDLRKKPQILFNYLGRVNTYFNNASYELAMEDTGYDLHAPEIKNSLLEFVARINGEQIAFELTYITEYHKEKTIVEILERMFSILDSFSSSENFVNATEAGSVQSYPA